MGFPPLLFDRRFLSGGPANHRRYLRKVLADLTLCHLNIVVVLQVKPKRRRGSECPGEPERGIRGYPGFPRRGAARGAFGARRRLSPARQPTFRAGSEILPAELPRGAW